MPASQSVSLVSGVEVFFSSSFQDGVDHCKVIPWPRGRRLQ